MISYKPFFITLVELNMQKDDVRRKANIAPGTMAKISLDPERRQNISMAIINKICWALGNVPIDKVIEYIPDEGEEKEWSAVADRQEN